VVTLISGFAIEFFEWLVSTIDALAFIIASNARLEACTVLFLAI